MTLMCVLQTGGPAACGVRRAACGQTSILTGLAIANRFLASRLTGPGIAVAPAKSAPVLTVQKTSPGARARLQALPVGCRKSWCGLHHQESRIWLSRSHKRCLAR
jgi:hypothetical protein